MLLKLPIPACGHAHDSIGYVSHEFHFPSHKIQDNYAKLLVRSDWDKLKKLCQKPSLADMEAMLFKACKAFEDQLAGIASASTPSAGSSATATAPMMALDQSYDALYQAQQKIVLAVGSRYMYSNEMYQLQQMDAQKLVLENVVLFDSSPPELLDGTTADAHLPPKSCQEAVKASKIFLGLLEASQQLQPKTACRRSELGS